MVVIVVRKSKEQPSEAHLLASAAVEEQYQNFDVVWAKLGSYPWWPAVLFYSWDAVINAGLELKNARNQLVIPPPTTQILADGKQRTVYSVLIMFLDRFDCNVVEVSPKTVCPFAINYHRLKDKPKKNGAGFNIALTRAMRLLHMEDHMTVKELNAIAPLRIAAAEEARAEEHPSSGKRQKRSHASHAAAKNANIEEVEDFYADDDDEDEVDFGSDYTDDEDFSKPSSRRGKKPEKSTKIVVAVPNAAPKKTSARIRPRVLDLSAGAKKPRGKHVPKHKHGESLDDDEDDGDFEIVNVSHKAAAKQTSTHKKASRKEGRIHVDVINIDDDEKESDSHDGDFEISIAHQFSEKGRVKTKKIKSPKQPKPTLNLEPAPPAKTKKKKSKSSQPDEDVQILPTPKQAKKKGPKRQIQHDDVEAHMHSVKSTPRDPQSAQPLTLTPLSAIWTTREASTGDADGKEDAGNFTRLAYKLDLLWDENAFTDEVPRCGSSVELLDGAELAASATASNNERAAGKRQVRSVQQSQIRQSMLTGNLDPHTMVQCEAYLPKGGGAIVEASNSRSRGAAPQIEAPFEVVVHPDVSFVCDLHSHLATCEIIGFLGGRWDDTTKTLYIQAAFPCRSLEIEGDDGSTDVEMDPGSEIELREIIRNAELEVVGWYHSHPAFAPDPSIRDIENQTSYQHLFQRSKASETGRIEISFPFVGLIVGTYDQRRESPVGLFRYFHTREERLNSGMRGAVHMPYELVPRKRYYRSVLEDVKRDQLRRLPLYASVAKLQFGIDETGFLRCPAFPQDAEKIEPGDECRESARGNNGSAGTVARKKRKGSSDLTQRGSDTLAQPAKKKRGPQKGWKKVAAMKAASATGVVLDEPGPEVIDLVTDASQELSQSQEQETPTPPEDVSSKNPIIADPDAIASEHVDMAIEESSQSQPMTDCSDVPRDCEKAALPLDSTDNHDTSSIVVESGSSQDIVCDSSQSQDTPASSADESKADSHMPNPQRTSLMTHDDDVVSASAPSSSSRSECSESYDASQSQNTSQSQVCSQPEDAVETSKCYPDEDDFFADVQMVEMSLSQNEDLAHVAETCKTSTQDSEVVALSSTGSQVTDSSENGKLDKEPGQLTAIQNDEVVGDSGADTAGHSGQAEGSEIEGAQVVAQQSPGDDDIVLDNNAAPGATTPVDRSSIAPGGRRRTRKPTTVRRNSGTPVSLGQPNASQVSPRPTSAPGNESGGTKDVGMKTATSGETGRSPMNDAKPAAKMAIGSDWMDGIEIIDGDILDANLRTKSEGTGVGEDDVVVKTDAEEASTEVMLKPAVGDNNDQSLTRMSETEASSGVKIEQSAIAMVKEQNEATVEKQEKMLLEEVVPMEQKMKEIDPSREGILPPRVISDAVVDMTTDQHEVEHAPSVSVPERRSKSSKVFDSNGALVEPLEALATKDLRDAIKNSVIAYRLPSGRGSKRVYISLIRENRLAMISGKEPPKDHAQTGTLLPSSSIGDMTDGVFILDAAKVVVGSMIDTAEAQLMNGAPPAAVQSNPQSLQAITESTKNLDDLEGSISKCQAVEDLSAVAKKVATGVPVKTGTLEGVLSAPAVPATPVKTETSDPVKTGTLEGVLSSPAVPPAPVKTETSDPVKTLTVRKGVGDEVSSTPAQPAVPEKPRTLHDRHAMYLHDLRTKYGPGVYGCTEQVITLIDYYRDFHRRTNLFEVWRAKVLKVNKIEASLRADVESINLPVALRDAFIKDIMGYLKTSWKLSSGMR